MYCRLESLEEREIDIHNHLTHNITFMGNVFKYSKNMVCHKIFEKLVALF